MANLRFMSWNWNCFSHNRNDLKADLISAQVPEVQIVALQEVNRRALEKLRERFPDWAIRVPEGPHPDVVPGPDPAVAIMVSPELTVAQPLIPDLTSWSSAGAQAHPDYPLTVDGIDGADPVAHPQSRHLVGVRVAVGSTEVNVVSAWPPHSAGKGTWTEQRVLAKRRTYAVLRQWLRPMDRVIVGMDANAWVDPGALADPTLRWDPTRPRLLGAQQDDIGAFVHNGYLARGLERNDEWPKDPLLPRDVFRIWLAEDDPERKALLADLLKRRPFGPLATTYVRGTGNYPYADRRDLVMVSNGIRVANVEHNYEDSLAAGSDHSYVLCDLEIDA